MAEEWLSRRQAADILGVRPETVGAWEANGLLQEMGIAMQESPEGHPGYSAVDVRRVRGEMTVEVRVWVDGERSAAMEEAVRAGLPVQLSGVVSAEGQAKPRRRE